MWSNQWNRCTLNRRNKRRPNWSVSAVRDHLVLVDCTHFSGGVKEKRVDGHSDTRAISEDALLIEHHDNSVSELRLCAKVFDGDDFVEPLLHSLVRALATAEHRRPEIGTLWVAATHHGGLVAPAVVRTHCQRILDYQGVPCRSHVLVAEGALRVGHLVHGRPAQTTVAKLGAAARELEDTNVVLETNRTCFLGTGGRVSHFLGKRGGETSREER